MNLLKRKSTYQAICTVLVTMLCEGIYCYTWYAFITSHHTPPILLHRSNLGMAFGMYLVFFLFWMNALGGFHFTIDRKMHVLISQVIALFLTDVLFAFVSVAIIGLYRLFGPILGRYLLMWLAQSLVSVVLSYWLISLANRKFPPLEMLEIYGSHLNDVEDKVNARFEQYHISNTISCDASQTEIREAILQSESVLINDVPAQKENDILKVCFELNKRVYFSPKISDILIKSSKELNLFDTPFYLCANSGLTPLQRVIKRFFDILLCALALIVLSPILLIVALAIKLEDGGPVFYKQERLTLNGRRFSIIKFRSMVVDAEKNRGPQLAGEDDPRITKVG